MFSFFRKIRKSLLNEGKTMRYFKYAIGEILLVIIGIIIALQLNAWAASKKVREYEIKMLTEIQSTLKQDLDYVNMILPRIKRIDDNSQAALLMLKEKEINKDELIKHIKEMYIGFVIQFNFGAYEALKSTGIDRVSNDELRSELVDFYEFKIPRLTKILSNSDNPMLRQQQHDLLWELFDFDVSDYQYQDGEFVLDIHAFKDDNFNDQRLYQFLYITIHQAKQSIYRLGFLINHLENLSALLKQELGELDD